MASDIGFINEDGKLGMHFKVSGCMDCQAKVHIPGRFSVYNSMVTMLVCHLAGISDEAVYGDALNHLQQEELLLKREGRIYLTDKGMDLNNYVVAQFML